MARNDYPAVGRRPVRTGHAPRPVGALRFALWDPESRTWWPTPACWRRPPSGWRGRRQD